MPWNETHQINQSKLRHFGTWVIYVEISMCQRRPDHHRPATSDERLRASIHLSSAIFGNYNRGRQTTPCRTATLKTYMYAIKLNCSKPIRFIKLMISPISPKRFSFFTASTKPYLAVQTCCVIVSTLPNNSNEMIQRLSRSLRLPF